MSNPTEQDMKDAGALTDLVFEALGNVPSEGLEAKIVLLLAKALMKAQENGRRELGGWVLQGINMVRNPSLDDDEDRVQPLDLHLANGFIGHYAKYPVSELQEELSELLNKRGRATKEKASGLCLKLAHLAEGGAEAKPGDFLKEASQSIEKMEFDETPCWGCGTDLKKYDHKMSCGLGGAKMVRLPATIKSDGKVSVRIPGPRIRINGRIEAERVRVIDDLGEMRGVMPREEALALAASKMLDLVEVNPQADPPVCKIVDYEAYQKRP